MANSNFNSSMVRLRVQGGQYLFGFVLFQFQYGAVERFSEADIYQLRAHFNSSMVRLRAKVTICPGAV